MPIEDSELEALFRDMESDRVERKESASDSSKIRQAICAFANDLPNYRKPGVIFVGQKDDGGCAKLTIDDDLLLRLGSWRSDGKVLPFPGISLRKVAIDGCEVVAIVVEPCDNPPVRCDGRTWVRTGPRRDIATIEEERRLLEKRRWGVLPYDAHGIPGTSIEDINLRLFVEEYLPALVPPDLLKADVRSESEQLKALRLINPEGLATVTALLMIGKNPRAWLPNAYIQFLRIDGVALTDAIRNQSVIGGTVPEQIRALDQVLKSNLEQRAVVGAAERVSSWDYPEVAVRQLLRNAILHRVYEGTNSPIRLTWYNDRIEILSPGGPFGQVTRENFGQPGVTDYRNPTIAEALHGLGYVERFGVGIALARQALKENGNPDPVFTIEGQHVHVMIGRAI